MGVKHKKTRKEKIIADYRHQVYILKDKDIPQINNPVVAVAVSENSFSNKYIIKDVLRTGILTFSIIVAQIILFFLLKRHVIMLPFIKY